MISYMHAYLYQVSNVRGEEKISIKVYVPVMYSLLKTYTYREISSRGVMKQLQLSCHYR